MASLTNTIPEKTIERLSEYRRTLLSCHRQGITHVFSHVLAGIHGITAVQVRRDLMLIGFSSVVIFDLSAKIWKYQWL